MPAPLRRCQAGAVMAATKVAEEDPGWCSSGRTLAVQQALANVGSGSFGIALQVEGTGLSSWSAGTRM